MEIKDKLAKETENKELKEKDKIEVILTPIAKYDVPKEITEEVTKVCNGCTDSFYNNN